MQSKLAIKVQNTTASETRGTRTQGTQLCPIDTLPLLSARRQQHSSNTTAVLGAVLGEGVRARNTGEK